MNSYFITILAKGPHPHIFFVVIFIVNQEPKIQRIGYE